MPQIEMHGIDERSAVYLTYDGQCAMARWGVNQPAREPFTLYSANGVAMMGRVVPGETPRHITACHIDFKK